MSKLCQYCGAEMDNEAYECPECLKKIPGAEMIIKRKAAEKKEKQKKIIKTTLISLAAVAFITGLTILVTFLTRKDSDIYMKPVKSYISGYVNNDYGQYLKAYHPYYQQMFNESYAYMVMGKMPSTEEIMLNADMIYHDECYKELANTYGSNFDITYKIYEENHLDEAKLKEYEAEFIAYEPDKLSETVFEDGYEDTVVFTIKGNLGSKSFTEKNFQVIKINGEWKMMSFVNFLAEEEQENTSDMRK